MKKLDFPKYFDDWQNQAWTCPNCKWQGVGDDLGHEYFGELFELHCPACDHKFGLISHPLPAEIRAAAKKGNAEALVMVAALDEMDARAAEHVKGREGRDRLPDIDGEALEFTFRTEGSNWMNPEWLVLTCSGVEIYRERSGFEHWEPLIDISEKLLGRYPGRIAWIDADDAASNLAGDNINAGLKVEKFLEEHGVGTTPIACEPGQEFTGYTPANLLPRLQLKPELEFVDTFERSLGIFLDGQELEDSQMTRLFGGGQNCVGLCSWGNGGEIGGRCDIYGGWLHLYVPGIRDEYTWIGFEVDLPKLAREQISDGLNNWEPESSDPVELTSPYLDASNADDTAWVRGMVPGASLNGVLIA